MKSISDLKEQADRLFRKKLHSMYPERVCCPTCGSEHRNKALQVGHAFRRNELSVRYDTRFATLQCGICNTSGNKEEQLKDWFRKRIPDWDQIANEERRKLIKRHDLEEIIRLLEISPDPGLGDG